MNPPVNDLSSASVTLPAIEDFIGSAHRVLVSELKELSQSWAVPVYLVGGPVRDLLMGWPARDLDFVVEGDAPAMAQMLARRVNGRVTAHSRFGTATVLLDDARIDLVTARKEVYPVPGALPVVEPSSLQDDLARRDFTINAMAIPLNGDAEAVIDPFGGRDDLGNGLVRALHSQSFRDDPTRLFRAARYEQRLGFTLSQETLNQLRAEVKRRICDTVSGDRLRRELELIFGEKSPEAVLCRAAELGLLSAIVPGLGQLDWLGRWAAVKDEIELEPETEWLPWLAALAYPLSPAEAEALIRRLNMPRIWAEVVRSSIELRAMESRLADGGRPLSELFRLLEGHEVKAVKVVAAITDSTGAAGNLGRFLEAHTDLMPALNGNDLLELGITPGPMVGQALAQLRDLRLDCRVNSIEEERQWVEGLVASQGCG